MQTESNKFPFPEFNTSENEPEYTVVKYLAIHQLGLQIFNALEMIHESYLAAILCEQSDEMLADIEEEEQIKAITPAVKRMANVRSDVVIPDSSLQEKVFNWSLQNFLQRLKTDSVWINIMVVQWSPTCLEFKKLNTDFKELHRLLSFIMQGYLKSQNVGKHIFKELQDIVTYNNISDDISEEFRETQEAYHSQNKEEFLVNIAARTSTKINFTLREGTLNPTEAHIMTVTKFRYEMNFHKAQEYQAEKRCELDEAILEQKINDLLKKYRNESNRFATVSTAYMQQIEDLRNRTYSLSSLYDMDFHGASEKVVSLKLKIKNLELRRQFLQEQQVRFREELEAYRLVLLERQRLIDEEEEQKRLLEQQKSQLKAEKLWKKQMQQQAKIAKMARQLRKATRVSESDLNHPKRKKQKTVNVMPRLDSITDVPVVPPEQKKKKKQKQNKIA